MKNTPPATSPGALRVLLVASCGSGSAGLAAWLAERDGIEVFGPVESIEQALTLMASYQPAVVLLAFLGLSVSFGADIARLKTFSPAPRVALLTHYPSATLRRRSAEAHIDAVFEKTQELDALAAWLDATRAAQP